MTAKERQKDSAAHVANNVISIVVTIALIHATIFVRHHVRLFAMGIAMARVPAPRKVDVSHVMVLVLVPVATFVHLVVTGHAI